MKREKNIFLTTIGETRNRLDLDYYECMTSDGYPVFTTGVSVAEAGIKTTLSRVRLDEIIVIGPASGVRSGEKEKTSISLVPVANISGIEEMSEYGFLNYRIAEYMNRLDIELLDIGERLSPEEKEEALRRLEAFRYSRNLKPGRNLFKGLSRNTRLAEEFESEVLSGLRKDAAKWLKYVLYDQLEPFYKMRMMAENRDTSTRFVSIETDGVITIESITKVVKETLSEEETDFHLYMDIQGLSTTDGNTLISTFLLLNRRTGYSCDLCGLISSYKDPAAFSGKVRNVLKSYEIQNLITGLDLFLEYGKTRLLKQCWKSLGITDPDGDRLLLGMECIDEGIAVCNTDLIVQGVNAIRKAVRNPLTDPRNRDIYMNIIFNAIQADYGGMLEADRLDVPELLKWCYRKKLYQQTLTMIESKVPEDIVQRGIYYYARNDAELTAVMEAFNVLYWNEPSKMRYSFNDVNHYFIKYYGRNKLDMKRKPDVLAADYARFRIDAMYGKAKELLPAFSLMNDDGLLYELLFSYYRVGNLRNQVNHAITDAGSGENESSTRRKSIRNDLDIAIGNFISLYTKACEKTKKTAEPVILSSDRMKKYARSHKLQPSAK